MARKRIGELLLERGVITREQLEEGLSLQRNTRQRLGVALVHKGFITEDTLTAALADALGLARVELKGLVPDWGAVHTLRPRFCESNDLFPVALEAGSKGRRQLVVAMADPLNLSAVEEIEFTTGLTVVPRVAPLSGIRAAILRYYHKVQPEEATGGGVEMMTVVQPGGEARVVDTAVHEEEEVIVGEEVKEPTERTSLAELVQRRAAGKGRRKGGASAGMAKDLDYLFGMNDEEAAVEALERKFWALMRLMAKKGLVTKEEFTQELDEGE